MILLALSIQTGRIFDGKQDFEFVDTTDFSESQFYDVRFDLPEDIIRNKRDSRFFPGTQPAGVKGITKELLDFIKHRVNPLGFEVDQVREKFEDGHGHIDGEEYIDGDIHYDQDQYF